MVMYIEFSPEKAVQYNRDLQECYDKLDRFFIINGLEKVDKGTYRCDDYCQMARAQLTLPNTQWFLDIVDVWGCNFESDDTNWMEDCLKSYYRVEAMTQARHAGRRKYKKSY